jgi:hypothetical protein
MFVEHAMTTGRMAGKELPPSISLFTFSRQTLSKIFDAFKDINVTVKAIAKVSGTSIWRLHKSAGFACITQNLAQAFEISVVDAKTIELLRACAIDISTPI